MQTLDNVQSRSVEQLLRTIERTIPADTIYLEKCNGRDMRKIDDIEEAFEIGLKMLKTGVPIETIAIMDPCCNYSEVVEKLRLYHG